MRERMQQVLTRTRDFFKNMNKRLRTALIAVGFVTVAVIAFLLIRSATRPYTILYSGLSSEDLTSVVSYLDSNGVSDFQVRNNDTVLVREDQANSLRAQLVMQGYPSSGYAYGTYLDNIGALSSQADREQLVLFDLQERLGKDIRCIDGVKDASVYLTPGEDRRYILSESVIEAKAGVIVTMQSGKELSSEQVSAIQRLVSSAMQGVEISSVEVTDNAGRSYSSGGSMGNLSDAAKLKLALEEQVNEQTRNSIMNVLSGYFGAENLRISVHSNVEVSHAYKESLIYEEPDWAKDGSTDGRGIIGHQEWDDSIIREGDETVGGTVGTSSNSEINEYVTLQSQINGNEREIYDAGSIDYDVTTHKVQEENPGGYVTDKTVAIAVNSAANVPALQNTATFIHLAAVAAGISAEVEADKIAIVSYPFYQNSGGGGETVITEVSTILGLPAWAVYAAIAGVALFLALMLILLLMRSKKKKLMAALKLEEEEREAAAAAALLIQSEPKEGANIMNVNVEESMRMRQDVRQFVEENPVIAAQMVKNWLRGTEE